MKHIVIHLLSTSEIEEKEEGFLSFVTNERRDKAKSYLAHEKRLEALGSGYFLKKYTDLTKELQYGKYGKPYKEGEFFSLSHSHGYVGFVLCDVDCGLDIEKIRPMKEKMFSYILSDDEKKNFISDKDFMIAWTRKEAIVKTLGGSIFADIKKIPSNEGKVSFEGETYFVSTLSYSDYVISVSLLGEEEISLELRKEEIPF